MIDYSIGFIFGIIACLPFILKKKVVLKNFHEFHKYNIGDKVVVKRPYDDNNIVCTIKSVHLHFDNGTPGFETASKWHNSWKQYYFNEIQGWLDEKDILYKF